jgi:hypothetical protein
MPSSAAVARASSMSRGPQHRPPMLASVPLASYSRSVAPMTSYPRSTSSAAAADESTPPDIATTTLTRPSLVVVLGVLVPSPDPAHHRLHHPPPDRSPPRIPRPDPEPDRAPRLRRRHPSASSTSDGASDPDVHAAPVDTLMPSRSSAAATNCPARPRTRR